MSYLQEVRVPNQYFLKWLTHGKYLNEIFKVQNLKIFCNFPLTSMGHVMFCAVISIFLVMICALVVLLAHVIIQTDENYKHQ